MDQISRVFAPLLFSVLRLPIIPQFKFQNLNMMHTWASLEHYQQLGMWQLTPTKQESRLEIQAYGRMKGKRKLAQSSRSRLHFNWTLTCSPSFSQSLALRTPANITWREEGDSRRVDLLKDRTTHGMRHSNISWAGRRSTDLKKWSGTDDEGSLGRQRFHA